MIRLIGITGGIATGKSTVSRYLKTIDDSVVIDADIISHQILESRKITSLVRRTFENVTDELGNIDRKKLGRLIFNDKEKRELLNDIMFPLIKKELKDLIEFYTWQNKYKFIFVEVPLLYEAGYEDLFNEIWCIVCEKETQINRLMNRDNIDREYALNKINSQMSMEEKLSRQPVVLNSENLDELKDFIKNLLEVKDV